MKFNMLMPFLVFFCSLCCGQSGAEWNFDVGYSGGIIVHPGINIGALKTIKLTDKVCRKGGLMKKEIQIGARTGFYFHHNYQSAFWLQGEIAQLRSKSAKRYHKYSLGVGGINTWVPKVYALNSQGDVEFERAKGIFYGLVSPAIEWGWAFQEENRLFYSWYIRPSIQWQFPYFLGTNEYLLFEVGFNLK